MVLQLTHHSQPAGKAYSKQLFVYEGQEARIWFGVLIGSPQGQDRSSVWLLLEFERESDFLVPPFTDEVSAYMRPDRASVMV